MTAKHGDIATGPGWELRCGSWQQVLKGVKCDALIADPPYDERTHSAHSQVGTYDGGSRRAIDYSPLAPDDVVTLVRWANSAARGWHVWLTDHNLLPLFEASEALAGRCTFAPVVWYAPGSRVRLAGDGPSSWCCWLSVSRPRGAGFSSWGTLPGGYSMPGVRGGAVLGAKPLPLMRAIVRDYSRPGDLVCDPYAGGATTLLAAVMEGRRAIGAEVDPVTFSKAVARLRQGFTPDLFAAQPAPAQRAEQGSLL